MVSPKRAPLFAALFALTLALAGCGLGRDQSGDSGAVRNPIVAATVNGRPIYVEDVRAHAVARGLLQEGQDLDANSDAFYFALEELIQVRLFAMEAEARGLDRQPDVRRQLENAREQVLAQAVYEEIDERATNPRAIERLYNENTARLGQGQEVHLRHIQFDTREAADAAKRRLDHGERFEALAFELSTDRESAADGGDMDWGAVTDLNTGFRQATEHASVGDLVGPVQIDGKWGFFDPMCRVYCQTADGRFPSIDEILEDPTLFTRMPQSTRDVQRPWLKSTFPEMNDFEYYAYRFFNKRIAVSMRLDLREAPAR